MTRRFSSISTQTTLATSISNSALSLVVATGTASTLLGGVALTAGNVDQFKVIIDPDTASAEIMYVTGVTSDTLTIQRGKDGTSAVVHSGGAVIKHVLTGEDLTYFTTGVIPTSNLATGLPFPGSTSGTNTLKAPAITGTVTNTLPATTGTLMSAESVDAATSKTPPVDADEIPLADSAASFGLKKLTWANLKATLKTYFDTLYATVASLSGYIANTLTTTTGDIIYASGANTPARLGIGSTANVLTVAGGVPTWAAPAAGKVAQIVNTQTGTTATGTTVLPNDGTIPQNTEGDQYMTLAITPTSATNILTIQVVAFFGCGVNLGDICTALFQDSTASALAAIGQRMQASVPGMSALTYRMVAGTTSATTFKVRIGNGSAGTTTFNPTSYGSIVASSITITESTP